MKDEFAYRKKPDALPKGGVPVDIEISNTLDNVPDPQDLVAKPLVDLIREGKTLQEAARETGLTEALDKSPTFKQRVQDLIGEAYVPPDVLRETVRAARNKVLVQMTEEGLKESDPKKLKIALEASKQIGMDPQIGLNQPPQPIVNIDLRDVRGILKDLEPLEGFEKPELEDDI